MDKNTHFLVTQISRVQKGRARGLEVDIKMCWADGMVGALPVFDTYESALKYADDQPLFVRELEPI